MDKVVGFLVGVHLKMDFEKAIEISLQHLKQRDVQRNQHKGTVQITQQRVPQWSWVAKKLVCLLAEYPSGLTKSIINAELEMQWDDARGQLRKGSTKKYRTLDSLSDGKSISPDSMFEAPVVDVKMLPGTRTCILTLACCDSARSLEMYLHQKYCFVAEDLSLDFLSHRQVRITGARSVTTPIGKTRLLPTEHMVFMLNELQDRQFLVERFMDSLSHLIRFENDGTLQLGVLVKVIRIEHARPACTNGRFKRLDVHVSDASGKEACLILWDEQIGLASLFAKNDSLAMWRPYTAGNWAYKQNVGQDVVTMECGSQTVIFCVPLDNAESDPPASATQNGNTFASTMDVTQYSDRMMISEIASRMIDVTLFGRVVEVVGNDPFQMDGVKSDRYGVRIADSSGQCDVTLWDDLGRSAIGSLSCGDWLLITKAAVEPGLRMETVGSRRKKYTVLARAEIGTVVWNVTAMVGFIASPHLRKINTLAAAAREAHDSFYFRGIISAWKKGPEGRLIPYAVDRLKSWATFPVDYPRTAFVVDDSTGRGVMEVKGFVASELIGISPSEFLRISATEQLDVLDALLGRHVEGCAVMTTKRKTQSYRLATVAAVSPSVQLTKGLATVLQ
ncbi:hypothetical protein DFJ77DRAFT_512833 [Powellomyces hirtus]|nr:hypothetical protein DFJ77DRAFT_512833 [Powellomyces hirtus]